VEYARTRSCGHVTCGHTHAPLESVIDGICYVNSGTWTEHPPCPFVAVVGDRVWLETWPLSDPQPVYGSNQTSRTTASGATDR
jgi:UDP-2,3-diacylglucosamine pyrophosphatase LpxH